MVIKSHAEAVLRDFAERIQRGGYDRAPKHAFAMLLGDMIHYWSSTQTLDLQKAAAVQAIQNDWQRDRIRTRPIQGAEHTFMAVEAYVGAETIASIIARTRALVAFLPTEAPAPRPGQSGYVKNLSHLSSLVDMRAFVE